MGCSAAYLAEPAVLQQLPLKLLRVERVVTIVIALVDILTRSLDRRLRIACSGVV